MFRSRGDIVRAKIQRETLDNEVHGCDYCKEGGWCSETEVVIHKSWIHASKMKYDLANKDFVCGICIKELKNDNELLNHIKTDHLYSSEDAYRVEREIFVCDYCCQIFFNKLHLIVHILNKHIDSPKILYVECPLCKLRVKRKQIWIHFYKHMVQSISTCRLCFTKCKNRRELKEHLNSHGHYFKCDMCGYNTRKSELFNQHISENHKRKIGKNKMTRRFKDYFIPRSCDLAGRGQIVMISQGVYIGNGVRICVLCREICLNPRQMRRHIIHDHYTPEISLKKEYKCACGVVFVNKVLLKHHIFKMKGDHRVVGDDDEQNSGNKCDKSISRSLFARLTPLLRPPRLT
ncbi:unnamed protein product [Euphydryas editha]|uniref:C2H2-type domain-containing protein n=1 Tax=Euphydryas editha TaxID=104508 RepID=A0AAU9T978_EUPED|nr:unnamed protein product [Euphydryas editha]